MAGGIEAVMVAAGRSERMGATNKLLLPVNGVPMIRHSAILYTRIASPVTVVLGSDDELAAGALAGLDIRIVKNHDVDAGQQQSVRLGLAAADLGGRGVLIALADQSLLTVADLRALIACFDAQDAARICIPRHQGRRGNPVLFPSAIAGHLRGPQAPTPRLYIEHHPDLLTWFDAAGEHFTADIDTPADAARLLGIETLPQ